jgi:hypothetical protein
MQSISLPEYIFMNHNFSRLVYPKNLIFTILLMTIFLFACSSDTQAENPAWINKLIKEFESNPVGNPPPVHMALRLQWSSGVFHSCSVL